jgi:hypothetical protein
MAVCLEPIRPLPTHSGLFPLPEGTAVSGILGSALECLLLGRFADDQTCVE